MKVWQRHATINECKLSMLLLFIFCFFQFIYSCLNDSALMAVKGMQRSLLGVSWGTIGQKRVYERGTFSVKNGT